jgi:hypothetical protein
LEELPKDLELIVQLIDCLKYPSAGMLRADYVDWLQMQVDVWTMKLSLKESASPAAATADMTVPSAFSGTLTTSDKPPPARSRFHEAFAEARLSLPGATDASRLPSSSELSLPKDAAPVDVTTATSSALTTNAQSSNKFQQAFADARRLLSAEPSAKVALPPRFNYPPASTTEEEEKTRDEAEDVTDRWALLEANWPLTLRDTNFNFREHKEIYALSKRPNSMFSSWLLAKAFDHPKMVITATSIVGKFKLAASFKRMDLVLLNCCKSIFLAELKKKRGLLLRDMPAFKEEDYSDARIKRFILTEYGVRDAKKKHSTSDAKRRMATAMADVTGTKSMPLAQWKIARGAGRYAIIQYGIDSCKTNTRKKIRQQLLAEILEVPIMSKSTTATTSHETLSSSKWGRFLDAISLFSSDLTSMKEELMVALNGEANPPSLTRSQLEHALQLDDKFRTLMDGVKEVLPPSVAGNFTASCKLADAIQYLLLPRYSFGISPWTEYLHHFLIKGFPKGKELFENDEWADVLDKNSKLESTLLVGYAVATSACCSGEAWTTFCQADDEEEDTSTPAIAHCKRINDYFGAIADLLEVDRVISKLLPPSDRLTEALASSKLFGSSTNSSSMMMSEDSNASDLGFMALDIWS